MQAYRHYYYYYYYYYFIFQFSIVAINAMLYPCTWPIVVNNRGV